MSGKLIHGWLPKGNIPENINEFNARLIEEEYEYFSKKKKVTLPIIQESRKNYRLFIDFTHKDDSEQNFTVIINNIKQPSNLQHIFKLEGEKFSLEQKISRKCAMDCQRQKKRVKREEHIDLSDSDDDSSRDIVLEQFS